MTENIQKALEIIRNFSIDEFHSFMELLYVSESAHSDISFNDMIGKTRFKDGVTCPHCGSVHVSRNMVSRPTNAKIAENSSPILPIPLRCIANTALIHGNNMLNV